MWTLKREVVGQEKQACSFDYSFCCKILPFLPSEADEQYEQFYKFYKFLAQMEQNGCFNGILPQGGVKVENLCQMECGRSSMNMNHYKVT